MSDLQASPLIDTSVAADACDLSNPEFWALPRDQREGFFHALRRAPELRYFDEWEFLDSPFPRGPGYWSLVDHEDIWFASRNPQLFASGRGGSQIGDMPEQLAEFFGSMISMDDPKHFRLRSIVSKGFTPKEISRVEGYVHEKATALVDRLLERFPDGTCDFVTEVAAPLPLQIICEMMGIPAEDEDQIFTWTNVILGAADPEFGGTMEALMTAAMGMFSYAQALGEDRRANPRDDLTTVMMHAEVDGERLDRAGVRLVLHPAGRRRQRDHAQRDQPRHARAHPAPGPAADLVARTGMRVTKTAVDEIVRWATPVIHFRRTATEDLTLKGTKIEAGQKVVLWYCSANRDEHVWANPYEFDVRRPLQPQQAGFGAGGPHFCLGANLARREIAVMFDEIRRRLPDMRITGEPDWLQSNFINGIKHLECAWK